MTMTMPEQNSPHQPDETPQRNMLVRFVVITFLVAIAVFWTWALFFASKDAVNKIDDRAWAERAERICTAATERREALTDFTRIDVEPTPEMIAQRADVVDQATDILEQMLNEVVAEPPTDAKGQAIVPDWEADYRTLLGNRRDYADQVREAGKNLPFYETAVDGIPISDKIAVFAGDNEMPACAPPSDLAA